MQAMLNREVEIKQQPTWSVAGRELALDRVLLMGIVNVTPDSFADGGRYFKPRRCTGACTSADR